MNRLIHQSPAKRRQDQACVKGFRWPQIASTTHCNAHNQALKPVTRSQSDCISPLSRHTGRPRRWSCPLETAFTLRCADLRNASVTDRSTFLVLALARSRNYVHSDARTRTLVALQWLKHPIFVFVPNDVTRLLERLPLGWLVVRSLLFGSLPTS